MSWARLDDSFAEHPKVLGLSDRAFRVYVLALCYCARNRTDGALPPAALRMFGCRAQHIEELADAGLWDETEHGWQVHDYLEYNPSAAQLVAKREATKERVNRWRNAPVTALHPESNGVSNTSPLPVPVPVTDLDNTSPHEASVDTVPRRRPRRTPLTVDFEEQMVTEFASKIGGEHLVRDAIEAAKNHEARYKAINEEIYLRRWLQRDVSKRRSGHEEAGGKSTSPYSRAARASPGEA